MLSSLRLMETPFLYTRRPGTRSILADLPPAERPVDSDQALHAPSGRVPGLHRAARPTRLLVRRITAGRRPGERANHAIDVARGDQPRCPVGGSLGIAAGLCSDSGTPAAMASSSAFGDRSVTAPAKAQRHDRLFDADTFRTVACYSQKPVGLRCRSALTRFATAAGRVEWSLSRERRPLADMTGVEGVNFDSFALGELTEAHLRKIRAEEIQNVIIVIM